MSSVKTISIFSILFIAICSNPSRGIGYNVQVVKDSVTAKKIAEAIFLSVYGKSIFREYPLLTTLQGDSVWIVESTWGNYIKKINKTKKKDEIIIFSRGDAHIEIRKSDCKILNLYHEK
ncbi:MAG: hypothetical protein H0X33_10170 [Taibaiella sp.]|nr:hypothetical protein [Taibaiella sp.]